MADVFAASRREAAAGRQSRIGLWSRELAGVARFAARTWRERLRLASPRLPADGSPRPLALADFRDVRQAWRGLRARRWRAVLCVGLLGVSLAATTVLFSAADSLVLLRLPYENARELVVFSQPRRFRATISPGQLDAYRGRREIFRDVHGYATGYTFLQDDSAATSVNSAFVTPGLVDMLGWRAQWGRAFRPGDEAEVDARVTIISERLARDRFGSPREAIGQWLETAEDPLLVVGVMPRAFSFPDGRHELWRPFDYRRVDASRTTGFMGVARLAPGVDAATADAWLETTASDADALLTTAPFGVPIGGDYGLVALTLIGAALCLLLIACANVASLELAGAMARARTLAVQHALGASRRRLMMTAALEAAALAALSVAAGLALATAGIAMLNGWLAGSAVEWAPNPIDLDARAVVFMTLIGTVAWLTTAMPVAAFAAKRNVVDVLKRDGAASSSSRGGMRVRRILTVVEVALAVVLLSGGVLYAKTYRSLAAIDKGFETGNLVQVDITWPPNATGTQVVADQIIEHLESRPYVAGVTRYAALDRQMSTPAELETERPAASRGTTTLSIRTVDGAFIETLQLRLLAGRAFEPADPRDHVVITDSFAERLWPGTDAVGRRFRNGPDAPWNTVIGVVGDPRDVSDQPDGRRLEYFVIYTPAQPRPARPATTTAIATTLPSEPGPPRPNVPASGPLFRFNTLLVRLSSPAYLDELTHEVRAADPRFELVVEAVDAIYARTFADRLTATRIVGAFGVLAFVVALSGVFGLMAHLVAARSREIGIRLALGAGRADVRRLVLSSSMRLVLTGTLFGIAGALAASRAIESQLFGVVGTDPSTYAVVAALVVVTAMAATWHPARQASRVDPAVTLRSE
jgi:putative ABC transport system permease protein